MLVVNKLYNPGKHPFKNRLVSVEKNQQGEPLIELQTEFTNNKKILVLKFIRSKNPIYTFDTLLNDVIYYANNNNYSSIILEDDSLFTINKNCKVRALIYRAFHNKNSIYVDRGFYPKNKDIDLDKHRNIIYNYKIRDALNLSLLLPKNIQSVINNIRDTNNNINFGDWLLNQKCCFYRDVINKIDVLAREVEIENYKILTNNSYEFLKSFRIYYKMHNELIMSIK